MKLRHGITGDTHATSSEIVCLARQYFIGKQLSYVAICAVPFMINAEQDSLCCSHGMETTFTLMTIGDGNLPVTGGFLSQNVSDI